MSNLTLTIDDAVLQRARIRALEQGTSVNAIVRDYLAAYAGESRRRAEAIDRVLAAAREARSARRGRRWTRDEIHER